MRANFPVLIPLNVEGAEFFAGGWKPREGIPPIPHPSLGNGSSFVSASNIALATAPKDIRRGYIQSWNFTIQQQLPQQGDSAGRLCRDAPGAAVRIH